MSDSISLIVAVVILFLVFRWVLGSNATSATSGTNSRGGATNHRRRNVTPDMVETVKNMFPDVPTAAIQADLAITGSVEITCNKILTNGSLPMPSHIMPRASLQSLDTAAPTSESSSTIPTNNDGLTRRNVSSNAPPSQPNLLERYQVDPASSSTVSAEEPAKVWSQDADSRQQSLLERKKFAIQEARRKFLEKQSKASQPAEGTSS
ncbi:hypothetical protein DSO57_1030631 [Entomophthora muscae]|uniref:Uncharacterized protein n=1 Tax=Entomophthora muscae TaxID=34485 RepID=A0ACC2RRT6_9FUNG|nr:hypothetical protein DSO57_1030631 [Entomophthora muscae]